MSKRPARRPMGSRGLPHNQHYAEDAALLFASDRSSGCKRCGIDAHFYIKDLLQRLPHMSNQDDYTHLLPQNWKPVTIDDPESHVLDVETVTV